MATMLERAQSFVTSAEILRKFVSEIFQLERLEKLSNRHPLIALAYAELIGNINYVLLAQESGELSTAGTVIGTFQLATEKPAQIKIADTYYPLTFTGRIDALGGAFQHFANQLNNMVSITNLQQGLISASMAVDIVKSTVQGSRVNVQTPHQQPRTKIAGVA